MQHKNNEILIIGSTPNIAGIGGVSIHVERLLQWLDKKSFDYLFCDYKAESLRIQFQRIRISQVMHLHISKPLPRLVYILYGKLFGTKSVMTVHGNVGRYSGVNKLFNYLAIKLCDVPVLINEMSYEKASKWNEKAILISVFLPPVEEGVIPEYVYDAIEKAKTEEKSIVACNASAISYTDKGEEIYGVTFAIDFFKNRKGYYLCISDPSGQYARKYEGQEFENVIFIPEKHSFYKLMSLSDIMLRPTATDGDSISVKEGLYLGKKVIATDRVDRPDGVITFAYNDASSLEQALLETANRNENIANENVVQSLLDVYHQTLNCK